MKYRIKNFSINKVFNRRSLPILILIVVLGLSIGYSAYTSTINITGIVGEVRAVKDVRITGVRRDSTATLEGKQNIGGVFDLEYGINNIEARVIMGAPNAMQVLAIEVTNLGNTEVGILSVNGLPEQLGYEFIGYEGKEKICNESYICKNGVTKEIYLAIYGPTGAYDIDIEIDFEQFYNITYTNISGSYPSEVLGGDTLEIDFGSNKPGNLQVKMGNVLLVKDTDYTYTNGVLSIPNVSGDINIEQPIYVLKAGQNFNADIKNLANNTTNRTYSTTDTTIQTIGFYGGGELPQNVTLQQLQTMSHKDVSAAQDESIMAYYDGNGNIYIYSQGMIKAQSNCSHILAHLTNLTNIVNLPSLGTSSVTNMNAMFQNCNRLTNLDLSNFNTSKVTSMSVMFAGCNSLSALDLSSFDTSLVADMSYMFLNCSSLTTLDFTQCPNFVTTAVVNMLGMFHSCIGLTTLDISTFNTSKVTTMAEMFQNCRGLTTLDFTQCPNFVTTSVTSMSNMFNNCRSLILLNVSTFNTSKVTNMSSMFYYCTSLTSLNLSNFVTISVTDMSGMFDYCTSLTTLDISTFNTSKVTNMSGMFYACIKLTSLNLSSFNTLKVTNMSSMFTDCIALTTLDLSNLDFTNVTTYSGMFNGVPTSATINLKDTTDNRNFMSTNFSSYTPTYVTP